MKSKSSTSSANSPNRNSAGWVGRSCVRLILFVLCLFVALPADGAISRSRTNARVDALPARALLTQPATALVDPNRQNAAAAIDRYQRPLFFAWLLAQTLALAWLWRSGNAARLRDAFKRQFGTGWMLRIAVGAALASLAMVAGLPLRFIGYRVAYATGLDTRIVASWIIGELIVGAIIATAVGLAVAVILWLVDRTRVWYLFAIPFVFAVVLVAGLAQPSIEHLAAPAEALDHADFILQSRAFAQRLRIAPPVIVVSLNGSTGDDRFKLEGIGPTTRVIVGRRIMLATTEPERAFAMARTEALLALREHEKMLAVWTALFIVCLAIAVTISDRIGFRRDDDPLSRLALVGSVLGLAVIAALPLGMISDRSFEDRADRMALAMTRDRAGAVRALVRLADDRMLRLCPPPFERWYFLRQAPIGDRIATIQGLPSVCH